MRPATSVLLAVAAIGAHAQLATVSPSRCRPDARDYVHMWWADGWRGRSPEGGKLRCFRSGRYAMAFDAENLRIVHVGAVAGPASYEAAGRSDDADLMRLPPADLDLSLMVDGSTYRAVRGGAPAIHSGPRIVESGRFLQRADITDLVFEDARGRRLDVDARLETVAWPDRLSLLLEASPARENPAAGPTFGRVGGGFCFDGTNQIEIGHAAALEPAQITVETWVYLPTSVGGGWSQWIVCKNGSEWGAGNYGLLLNDGVPAASLNIGGGRQNMHLLTGAAPGQPVPPLTREQWHHLALTYDGTDMRLYVDGRERGAEHIGISRRAGTGGLAIGRRQDNSGDGYHFRGVLDELRIYRRALSAEELASHWAKPEAVRSGADVVGEWAFDPNGAASPQRPAPVWSRASLRIATKADGKEISSSWSVPDGQEWRIGDRRQVSVVLWPGGGERAAGARVSAAGISSAGACPVARDNARGWHWIDLDALRPAGTNNNELERARVTVENPTGAEEVVRLVFAKTGAGMKAFGAPPTGLSPMLRDTDGFPLGIPVQLSKNWHSQPDRDLLYQGVWLHAASLLRVPAHSRTELEFSLAYAHWGGLPAASHAQLCLIGWGSNQVWNQSAIGGWGESICYEPDQAQAEAAVLDVRPLMVYGVTRPPAKWTWTNNVGGGDWFRYFDAKGERQFPARMRTSYTRHGPDLTEVTYAGMSQDGKLQHRATVSLYRSDDIVRGVYHLRLDVREAAEFTRFVIFQIGSDTYSYTAEHRMALGNEDGLIREWNTVWGGNLYRTEPVECAGRVPWISLHEAVPRPADSSGAWANRGIVIRRWDARLGGKPARPWMREYGAEGRVEPTSLAEIVPPPGLTRLLPGDYVDAVIEHAIVPQRSADYYGPNANLAAALQRDGNTWRMIHREAVANHLDVRATVGKVERVWPPRIRASADRASFTIAGGLGCVPITVSALTRYREPVIEMRAPGGAWRRVDQSVHGNDFWQTDYDASPRLFEITYTVPLDAAGDTRTTREFRFRFAGDVRGGPSPGTIDHERAVR